MRFDILTLFPEMFTGVLGASMMRIAREKGACEYHIHDFRRFARGAHRKVDDRPYGGGPGMVLMPGPIYECLESFLGEDIGSYPPIVLLTPQGERYNQKVAHEFSRCERLVLICGHYEGFDERIREGLPVREVSIGDYVLTGGELPALVVVDSVVRLLPGVLGDADSACYESFAGSLLDHPHYTRPVEFRGMVVPEVLRSGDHAKIARWRRQRAEERTQQMRPDLHEGERAGDSDR